MTADNMADAPEPLNDLPALSRLATAWTHVLRGSSLFLALAAAGLSLWFFFGFAANDQYPLHLLSAALLCFGVGAPAYIPAFLISRAAHKALQIPPSRRQRWMAAILVLPWLPLGWHLSFLGDLWMYCAVLMTVYVLFVIVWALVTSPARVPR